MNSANSNKSHRNWLKPVYFIFFSLSLCSGAQLHVMNSFTRLIIYGYPYQKYSHSCRQNCCLRARWKDSSRNSLLAVWQSVEKKGSCRAFHISKYKLFCTHTYTASSHHSSKSYIFCWVEYILFFFALISNGALRFQWTDFPVRFGFACLALIIYNHRVFCTNIYIVDIHTRTSRIQKLYYISIS